jgi:hypothetical protein
MNTEKTALVRALNDRLRVTHLGGRTLLTRSVAARGAEFVRRVMRALESYDQFCPDNDPYAEHDFGGLEVGGERLFWKIDYYDTSLTFGAEDPSDPSTCQRVLTIMLADEY